MASAQSPKRLLIALLALFLAAPLGSAGPVRSATTTPAITRTTAQETPEDSGSLTSWWKRFNERADETMLGVNDFLSGGDDPRTPDIVEKDLGFFYPVLWSGFQQQQAFPPAPHRQPGSARHHWWNLSRHTI